MMIDPKGEELLYVDRAMGPMVLPRKVADIASGEDAPVGGGGGNPPPPHPEENPASVGAGTILRKDFQEVSSKSSPHYMERS